MLKLLIPCLFLCSSAFSQSDDMIWKDNPDSIVMVIYNHVSKEMSAPNGHEKYVELGRATLDKSEIGKFIKRFDKPQNYKPRIALLTHHNVVFEIYSDSIIEFLEISTLTRTVYHYHTGADKLDFGFILSLSKKLEKWTKQTLKKHDLLELISEDLRFPQA